MARRKKNCKRFLPQGAILYKQQISDGRIKYMYSMSFKAASVLLAKSFRLTLHVIMTLIANPSRNIQVHVVLQIS